MVRREQEQWRGVKYRVSLVHNEAQTRYSNGVAQRFPVAGTSVNCDSDTLVVQGYTLGISLHN